MPTDVISYVGSSASWTAFSSTEKAYYTDTGGSNYTTPQLWDDDYGNTTGDLVADDEMAIAELNAESFIGELSIRLDWTTDPTHHLIIRARVGSEYSPTTDTGVKLWRNADAGIFSNARYTRFERLRIGSSSYDRPIQSATSLDNTVDCRGCTIFAFAKIAQTSHANDYLRSCILIVQNFKATSIIYKYNLRNCTIINHNTFQTVLEGTAYNTVVYNYRSDLSSFSTGNFKDVTGDYNAGSLSNKPGPPGDNSIDDVPSTVFNKYGDIIPITVANDYANASPANTFIDFSDFSLSGVDSQLYQAGSSIYAPELDNNGVPFNNYAPSIGAFEFIPTPPTPTWTPPAFELGTFKSQQGDVSLFQTDDGGDITALDGIVTMGGGLETAVYLSLFGGNEDDDGRQDSPADWWGNIDETDPAREYHSETQHLLRSLPATTGNLRRLEDAARRDLSWLESDSVASSVTVSASIPGVNKIKLEIYIEAIGEESSFEYVENWKADA
jgi:phage gp46-like protein